MPSGWCLLDDVFWMMSSRWCLSRWYQLNGACWMMPVPWYPLNEPGINQKTSVRVHHTLAFIQKASSRRYHCPSKFQFLMRSFAWPHLWEIIQKESFRRYYPGDINQKTSSRRPHPEGLIQEVMLIMISTCSLTCSQLTTVNLCK